MQYSFKSKWFENGWIRETLFVLDDKTYFYNKSFYIETNIEQSKLKAMLNLFQSNWFGNWINRETLFILDDGNFLLKRVINKLILNHLNWKPYKNEFYFNKIRIKIRNDFGKIRLFYEQVRGSLSQCQFEFKF